MKEEEFRMERDRLTHECQQAKIAFDKVVGSEAQYLVRACPFPLKAQYFPCCLSSRR
jgi:hypothetical protein